MPHCTSPGSDASPCASYGKDFADCRPVQLSNPASCSTEKDVGQRMLLRIIRAFVDIKHDFPGGTRDDVIEVADGKYDAEVCEINAVGMPFIHLP
jgi:hypothetical protein